MTSCGASFWTEPTASSPRPGRGRAGTEKSAVAAAPGRCRPPCSGVKGRALDALCVPAFVFDYASDFVARLGEGERDQRTRSRSHPRGRRFPIQGDRRHVHTTHGPGTAARARARGAAFLSLVARPRCLRRALARCPGGRGATAARPPVNTRPTRAHRLTAGVPRRRRRAGQAGAEVPGATRALSTMNRSVSRRTGRGPALADAQGRGLAGPEPKASSFRVLRTARVL